MSNSQFDKLKSEIKNSTEVTLKISSNVVGDSNDENNFSHNIKLSETPLHKIGQSGGFLGRLLGPLQKTGLL